MPGRTRRVRLLAAVLCIITVFILYERNVASVDQYADYWTKSKVGGGAVLRNDKAEQEPLQQYASESDPVYRSTSSSASEATTSSIEYLAAETKYSVPSIGIDEEYSIPTIPTKTPAPDAPTYIVDGETNEDRLGSAEEEILADVYASYGVPAPTATTARVHWSKLPEKFPITSTIQLPTGAPTTIPRIQKQGEGKGRADTERLEKIREAAKHAWNGFRTQGWDYDEVKPVSGGGQNSFNGWGATLVDSLDTLWIMGLKDEFLEAVNKTSEIDFTYSSRQDIPLFEVTIRYLGGMLGAYDVSGRKHRVLLDKAVELAELLYSAFDTPNRMPETYYHWKPAFAKNAHRASTRAVMAEIGTLSLEFTRLAQLTMEPKYYDAIARITDEFEKWQNNTRLPGMWPTDMDASGCKKPIRVASTPTKKPPPNQIPLPGSNDKNMIASEPVKPVRPVGLDELSLPKVKEAIEPVDEVTQKDGSTQHMGSVANPSMNHAMNGHAAAYNSNLRHSMDDDPWVKQNSPVRGDTTNNAQANAPLRPGAGSSEAGVKIENPSVGNRPSDPLLPNAGGAPHQKRGIDDVDFVAELAKASEMTEDDLDIAANLAKELTDEELRDLAKTMYQTDPSDTAEAEALKDAKGVKEPEDECQYQGFESVSKYSNEMFTLGGKSDSTFEYLPKEYLLLGGRLEQYKTMYLDSMKPVIDKLIFRPMTENDQDVLVSGEVSAMVNHSTGEVSYNHVGKLEHLTCFAGGMFAMGGMLFDKPEHVEIGRKLTDGCVWAYNSTASGIMPDGATLLVCEDEKDCHWNQTTWHLALDWQGPEFRQQQIDEWKKEYEIDDIPAWRAKKAAEEAAAVSSYEAAASLAAATAMPSVEIELNDPVDAPEPASVPEVRPDLHHNSKRQLDDTNSAPAAQPLLAPTPTPTPTEATSASNSADVYDDELDISGNNAHVFNGQYADELPTLPASMTAPSGPIYTPDPPLSHEEHVKIRIQEDGIPPGFVNIGGNGYILRPEAIESVFYMYRITGEQYWRDVGWKMFLAVETLTRTQYGHSSLDDVTKAQPRQTDKMESFWLAETLKYFYLLFDDPDTWSLDDWVLNTEAHFFQRPKSSSS